MISKEIQRKLKEKNQSFIIEFEFSGEKYIQALEFNHGRIQYFYYKIEKNDIFLVKEEKTLKEFIKKYEFLPNNIYELSINDIKGKKASGRIENKELKKWIIKFAEEKLNSCDAFARVYGKKFGSKKIKKLEKFYIDKDDYERSGYQCGNEITLCISGKDGGLYTVDDIENDEKKKQTALHEAIHFVLQRDYFISGMLMFVKDDKKRWVEIGRGLNEGLTEWITEKCGFDVSMGGYNVLTTFIKELEVALGEDAIMALGKGKNIHKILNMSPQETYAFLAKSDNYYRTIKQMTRLNYIISVLENYRNIESFEDEKKDKVIQEYNKLLGSELYKNCKIDMDYENYLQENNLNDSSQNSVKFFAKKREELEQEQKELRTDIESEIYSKYFEKELQEVLSMQEIPDNIMEKYNKLYKIMIHPEGLDRTSKFIEMRNRYIQNISKNMKEKYENHSLTVSDFIKYLDKGGDIIVSGELEKIIVGYDNLEVFFLVSKLKEEGKLAEIEKYSIKKLEANGDRRSIYFKENKPYFELKGIESTEITNEDVKKNKEAFDFTLETNEDITNIISEFENLREKILFNRPNTKFYILDRIIITIDGEEQDFYMISDGIQHANVQEQYGFDFAREEQSIDEMIDIPNLPVKYKSSIYSKITSFFRKFRKKDINIYETNDNIKDNNVTSYKDRRKEMIRQIEIKTPNIIETEKDNGTNKDNGINIDNDEPTEERY